MQCEIGVGDLVINVCRLYATRPTRAMGSLFISETRSLNSDCVERYTPMLCIGSLGVGPNRQYIIRLESRDVLLGPWLLPIIECVARFCDATG